MKFILQRERVGVSCTLGTLVSDNKSIPKLYTLEDRWKNNLHQISCIPAGVYTCISHGWNGEPVHMQKVWEVTNVPNRQAILIHAGNTHRDTLGCILVGTVIGTDGESILQSVNAINILRSAIGATTFTLEIYDIPFTIKPN